MSNAHEKVVRIIFFCCLILFSSSLLRLDVVVVIERIIFCVYSFFFLFFFFVWHYFQFCNTFFSSNFLFSHKYVFFFCRFKSSFWEQTTTKSMNFSKIFRSKTYFFFEYNFADCCLIILRLTCNLLNMTWSWSISIECTIIAEKKNSSFILLLLLFCTFSAHVQFKSHARLYDWGLIDYSH